MEGFLYSLSSILIWVIVFLLYKFFKCKDYIDSANEFFDEYIFDKDKYITNRELKEFLEKYKNAYDKVAGYRFFWKIIEDFVEEYSLLKKSGEDLRKEHNIDFINKELVNFESSFSNIDNKSLDGQQRVACIVDDDYNLVLAGAGSGKTLTICGKIKYLLEKGVSPDRILCISFTNKACDELKSRLNRIFGINVDVKTFHKLALGIIEECCESFDIADENKINQFIEEIVNGSRSKDDISRQLKAVVYFNMYINQHIGENLQDVKCVSMKSIVEHLRELKDSRNYESTNKPFVSISQEIVKSEHELDIANFLFLNGIDYEYESTYVIKEKYYNMEFPRYNYHPDFYLPKYNIYIEHFGIDESGEASWIEDEEERKKYSWQMEQKKLLHERQGTKLVCTYSYEREKLFEVLYERLSELGVEFHPISEEVIDLFEKIYDFDNSFTNLVSTFIKLFKNRNYDIKKFDEFCTTFKANYHEMYILKLIKQIYIKYQECLDEHEMIDFEDMIIKANSLFDEYEISTKYDYIIVDEYQDVSVGKVELLKNLISLNNAKLLCVGDDWQSIYRFAGSEVSMITDFRNQFENPMIMKIEKTYRNSKELIDVASKFVLRNPVQIKKDLKSNKQCVNPVIVKGYTGKTVIIPQKVKDGAERKDLIFSSLEDSRYPVLLEVLDEMYQPGVMKEVLLLVRNNFDLTIINYWLANKLCALKPIKNRENLMKFEYKNIIVKCMTIHKSKGLEADEVILFDIKEGLRGLPDSLGDDKLLRFVLASQEGIDYAEDRRLFYVALTRTKNRVYIISSVRNISSFVNEISKYRNVDSNINDMVCPKCKSYLVKYEEVYLCSNPKCAFKVIAENDKELMIKVRDYRFKNLKNYKRNW